MMTWVLSWLTALTVLTVAIAIRVLLLKVRRGLDESAAKVQGRLLLDEAPSNPLNMDRDQQITPAPLVDGVTLRSWLVHHHPGQVNKADGIWGAVVARFYTRAAEDPVVASYFGPVIDVPERMADLQRHFLAMLVMLTSTGLTSRMVARLHAGHAHVTNAAGEPITPDAYDRAIRVLVAVLTEYGVPPAGLTALSRTIWPLREILTGERAQ